MKGGKMKEIKLINKEQQVQEQAQKILKEKEYELVQVPTGNAIAIQTPEGDIINNDFAMVEILNKLNKMEKALLG